MNIDQLISEMDTPETKKLAGAVNRALRADPNWLYKLLNTELDTNLPSAKELLETNGFMSDED